MTKTELADNLAKEHGLTKKVAGAIVDSIFDPKLGHIAKALADKKDGSFAVVGFGTLTAKRRESRNGRNPATGETVVIPAKVVITFKPGTTLKASVNL